MNKNVSRIRMNEGDILSWNPNQLINLKWIKHEHKQTRHIGFEQDRLFFIYVLHSFSLQLCCLCRCFVFSFNLKLSYRNFVVKAKQAAIIYYVYRKLHSNRFIYVYISLRKTKCNQYESNSRTDKKKWQIFLSNSFTILINNNKTSSAWFERNKEKRIKTKKK